MLASDPISWFSSSYPFAHQQLLENKPPLLEKGAHAALQSMLCWIDNTDTLRLLLHRYHVLAVIISNNPLFITAWTQVHPTINNALVFLRTLSSASQQALLFLLLVDLIKDNPFFNLITQALQSEQGWPRVRAALRNDTAIFPLLTSFSIPIVQLLKDFIHTDFLQPAFLSTENRALNLCLSLLSTLVHQAPKDDGEQLLQNTGFTIEVHQVIPCLLPYQYFLLDPRASFVEPSIKTTLDQHQLTCHLHLKSFSFNIALLYLLNIVCHRPPLLQIDQPPPISAPVKAEPKDILNNLNHDQKQHILQLGHLMRALHQVDYLLQSDDLAMLWEQGFALASSYTVVDRIMGFVACYRALLLACPGFKEQGTTSLSLQALCHDKGFIEAYLERPSPFVFLINDGNICFRQHQSQDDTCTWIQHKKSKPKIFEIYQAGFNGLIFKSNQTKERFEALSQNSLLSANDYKAMMGHDINSPGCALKKIS